LTLRSNHSAGAGVGHDRAKQARHVDAEMVVEAAVFGRQHRLDQMIRKLIERNRIVVTDAARADLVAEAVEEGDRKLGLLQPILVGGLAEGRHRQRQHQDKAATAERGSLGDRLDEQPAPPARHMEPVHEDGVALIKLASPGPGLVDAKVDARIEVEQNPAQPRLPVVALGIVKKVAQSVLSSAKSRPAGRIRRVV
jgi:hypothetical protein